MVAETVLALTPGASESLVSQLLTDQGRTRDLGQVALALGLVTAVVALIGAAGQIERGANRIYGVDQDRPALHKYLRALLLTLVAGLPALVASCCWSLAEPSVPPCSAGTTGAGQP